MTDTITHGLTVQTTGEGAYRRACACGYQSAEWQTRFHPNPQPDPDGCPRDNAVRALVSLQFGWGGLFDGRPADGYNICLIRSTNSGTPGPTLCGIDRFAKDAPGWSVGGGISGPGIVHNACPGCVQAAIAEFPDVPVRGSVGAAEVRAAIAEAGVR